MKAKLSFVSPTSTTSTMSQVLPQQLSMTLPRDRPNRSLLTPLSNIWKSSATRQPGISLIRINGLKHCVLGPQAPLAYGIISLRLTKSPITMSRITHLVQSAFTLLGIPYFKITPLHVVHNLSPRRTPSTLGLDSWIASPPARQLTILSKVPKEQVPMKLW